MEMWKRLKLASKMGFRDSGVIVKSLPEEMDVFSLFFRRVTRKGPFLLSTGRGGQNTLKIQNKEEKDEIYHQIRTRA